MNEFHFLRPHWLWALLAVVALVIWFRRSGLASRSWAAVCDARLLPYLLTDQQPGKSANTTPWLLGCAATLLVLALAGPTWERLPQPVFRDQSALVIALDLSRSMQAADLKPSRLTRASLKITDILKARKGGQTALVVYAGEAFTVTPLTDDIDTIIAQLKGLEPDLMPSQGSRTVHAVTRATDLLQQAGASKGEVILVTDGVQSDGLSDAVTALRNHGYRLSILGVATTEGAPIALPEGGFLKDRKGTIVIPRLDRQALQDWARQGGGRYTDITTDDRDLQFLLQNRTSNSIEQAEQASGLHSDQWREQGPWLILLLIPLAALAFRRGLWSLLLVFLLPMPQPAQAMDWNDLWLRDDQQAMENLRQGNLEQAAKQFQDLEWKATAQYRAGKFAEAAATLEGIENPEALYNRGNALAQSGDVAGAMASYEQALSLDPDHEDARYNLTQLQQEQKQQQEQQQESSSEDSQNSEDSKDPGDNDPSNRMVKILLHKKTMKKESSRTRSNRTRPATRVTRMPGNPLRLTPAITTRHRRRKGKHRTPPDHRKKNRRNPRETNRLNHNRISNPPRKGGQMIFAPEKNRNPPPPRNSGCGAFPMIPVACCGANFFINTSNNRAIPKPRRNHGKTYSPPPADQHWLDAHQYPCGCRHHHGHTRPESRDRAGIISTHLRCSR